MRAAAFSFTVAGVDSVELAQQAAIGKLAAHAAGLYLHGMGDALGICG